MGTNVRFLVILLFGIIFSGCIKDCTEQTYSFDASSTVSPEIDSVKFNDTIWIKINVPFKLTDKLSGKNIDFHGAINLGTDISLLELVGGSISDPGTIGAIPSFQFELLEGKESSSYLPNQTKVFTFSEGQFNYEFKLGIVPKKLGIFLIAIGNATNVFTSNEKCSKSSFSFPLTNIDHNLYFLEMNRPGYTLSGLELTNAYCFKVTP